MPPTMILQDGRPVNAVYGFTSVLIKALREFRPEYIVLTFDMKGPTFRHIKYTEYKAHREKAPDELYAQIPMVKEVVRAFNIPIFELSGFEADDLIGTISKKIDGDVDKIIVTGDMDTLQLVNEHTRVYTMSRGMSESILYGPDEVVNKYSLTPTQIIDYKALRGDPSDNIPGVRGIGEKTATELLTNFQTLDGVYQNIDSDKIKERIRGLLIENKANAYVSKDLATIKCDVDIDFDLQKAVFKEFNKDDIINIFDRFEFRSLLSRAKALFDENIGVSKEDVAEISDDKFKRNKEQFDYILVDDEKTFADFFKNFSVVDGFTFDTETTGIDTMSARLLGISISFKEAQAYYLNFDKQESGTTRVEKSEENNLFNYQKKKEALTKNKGNELHPWLAKLAPIFKNEKIKKNGHNVKFDLKVLESQGLEIKGIDFDTMLASYILKPGGRQFNLDAVTYSELGFEKISKTDLLGKGRDKVDFAEVETEKLYLYSCEDADFTHRLQSVLRAQLAKENFLKLFNEIELPLTVVLAKMENTGIKLDVKFLEKMGEEVLASICELEKNIFKLCGKTFNIKSTQQLGIVLFEDLKISIEGIKKNKKGHSTAFDELEKIKDAHAVIPLIQEYRELTKLQSTYIDALPKLVNKKTKRIHTSFNQTIAATGRLSSTDPNLQNIPVRTEIGKKIRQAFIASDSSVLLAFDYSQIELRLAAHMSGDETMIKAFNDGVDIHVVTASLINGVKIDEVTSQMRREAKAVNFGILYGQGAHGLSQGADISYTQAKSFIENYFKIYSGVKSYLDKTIEDAKQNGFVETLYGRKRYLPDLNSNIPMMKKSAERMAVNTPIQGTAADMIKIAMIKIHNEVLSDDIKMLLQVHDELVFEVKKGAEKTAVAKIKKIMENVIKLQVEMRVDVKVGQNWGEMKTFL